MLSNGYTVFALTFKHNYWFNIRVLQIVSELKRIKLQLSTV